MAGNRGPVSQNPTQGVRTPQYCSIRQEVRKNRIEEQLQEKGTSNAVFTIHVSLETDSDVQSLWMHYLA